MKINIKNRTDILIVTIVIILPVLIIWFSFTSEKSPEKATQENKFELPRIEKTKEEYNTKIEAYEGQKQDRKKEKYHNISHILEEFNERTPVTPIQTTGPEKYQNENDPDIQRLERELKANRYNGEEIIKEKKTSGSSVKSPKKEIKKQKNEKRLRLSPGEKRRRLFSGAQEKSKEKIDIMAEIANDQTITSGKEIRFRLMEDYVTGDQKIPGGTYIYGSTRFDRYRIFIDFTSIQYQGRIIPFNRAVYDLDGLKGISIAGNEVLLEVTKELREEALNTAVDDLADGDKMKAASGAIKSVKTVLSGKNKTIKANVVSGHRVILRKEENSRE